MVDKKDRERAPAEGVQRLPPEPKLEEKGKVMIALRAPMRGKFKKVVLRRFYCLAGEYDLLHDCPNEIFHDVVVTITQEIVRTYHDPDYDTHIVADFINIEGHKTIECEIVRAHYCDADGTYVIDFCQDWG